MHDTVQRSLRLQCQVPDGSPLWVAVSGGVDSMVLMHVLHDLGHQVHVLHVDHGLRGAESDADRELVVRTAAALGLPTRVERVDVVARRSAEGGSMQMAARTARYEVFHRAVEEGPGLLSMAHHGDDAVETMLMQLLRGMGTAGWSGIPMRSGAFIRPLLSVPRAVIEDHARRHHIPFREDASNADPAYLRNRVRHELLPMLEELRPGARRVLQRNVALAREMHALAEERAREVEQSVRTFADGRAELPIAAVEASVAPLLLLSRFAAPAELHPDRVEALWRAIAERHVGARFDGPALSVQVERTVIVRIPLGQPLRTEHVVPIDPPWPAHLPLRLEVAGPNDLTSDHPPSVLILDADALQGSLRVRPWRRGDRIAPTGMKGSKLISDMLVDARVPLHRKGAVHVLEDDRGVLWCCGFRRSRLALPRNRPGRLLKITYVQA
ncbi:MAG: tRNA lysidine(34) synthetase TilS [Flavobacteriales bacterium]